MFRILTSLRKYSSSNTKKVVVLVTAMMVRHRNTIKDAVFIFCQIIVATINAELTVLPTTLHFKLLDHNQLIEIEWTRTQGYLANHNLPVWYAQKNGDAVLVPNISKKLGLFAMYHDVDKSSAVVYFHNSGCVFGNIDTRFVVTFLPLSEIGRNKYHIVGGPYVWRRAINTVFHDHLFHPFIPPYQTSMNNIKLPTTYETQFIPNSPFLSVEHSSTSHQSFQSVNDNSVRRKHKNFDTLYPEILLYVSYDVAQKFKTVESLVGYYLIHLNIVDMLFVKLVKDGVKIHINVAGLILESEKDIFPYKFYNDQPFPWHIIDGHATLLSLSGYFKTLGQQWTEDSFDFFILSTNYDIWFDGEIVDGLARMDLRIYDMRRASFRDIGIHNSPGILVHHRPDHEDFATYAHEIAHLMKIGHDSNHMGYNCFNTQCYAILQPTASFCRNCIVWSLPSRIGFQTYASTNYDHCFLLNPPRSLHPLGRPIRTITPQRQCACYGYESYWTPSKKHPFVHECKRMLMCTLMGQPIPNAVPPPIDGTPCGPNQVCWDRECQLLTP